MCQLQAPNVHRLCSLVDDCGSPIRSGVRIQLLLLCRFVGDPRESKYPNRCQCREIVTTAISGGGEAYVDFFTIYQDIDKGSAVLLLQLMSYRLARPYGITAHPVVILAVRATLSCCFCSQHVTADERFFRAIVAVHQCLAQIPNLPVEVQILMVEILSTC